MDADRDATDLAGASPRPQAASPTRKAKRWSGWMGRAGLEPATLGLKVPCSAS